jgi:hypothetical protein
LPKFVAATTLNSVDWHSSSLLRDGAKAAALRLTSTTTTGAGVIIATSAPAGPAQYGSYELEDA